MEYLRRLEDITLEDVTSCGGKAARLGEAVRLGCPSPPGVVLSTDLYRRFMRQGGLQGEIVSILSSFQPTTMHQCQAAEWAIKAAFDVRRVPQETRDAMREALAALGGFPVAIRSSATSEDSPRVSFVGQHDTYTGVTSLDQAVKALVGCWESLFSAKALYYAHRFGVDLTKSAMAILIQGHIEPTLEGDLSTVDPITGNPDEFVLEIQSGTDAGLHYLDPYTPAAGESAIWRELRKIGLRLDEHFCTYQTIHWVVCDDGVSLLRVRPVTSVPPFLPVSVRPKELGKAPLELALMPGENPRELRPHSWYHRSRSRAIRAAYFGRVSRRFSYYSGRDDYYLRGYLYTRWRRFTFSVGDQRDGRSTVLMPSIGRLLLARALDREFRALWRVRRPRLLEMSQTDLGALSDDRLGKFLAELQGINEAFLEQAGRIGESPSMLADILRVLHRRWLGDEECLDALLRPVLDQCTWAERELDIALKEASGDSEREEIWEKYAREHRHLYLCGDPIGLGTDICALTVDQHALQDLRTRTLASEGTGPAASLARQQSQRRELETSVVSRLGGLRRAVYRYVLGTARRYAPLEVDKREPALLGFLLERDVVLEVGRRLVDRALAECPEDGCFLGHREIMAFLRGEVDCEALARTVRERRALFRRWRRYSPPRTIEANAGREEKPGDDQEPSEGLRGCPVSHGSAQGRVRIVRTLGEARSVLPGEVLVCVDPSFELSPLFGIVNAVVCESGGLLDYSATLVREYDVPAIFGVAGATNSLRTGQEVHVDGTRGVVTPVQIEHDWLGL